MERMQKLDQYKDKNDFMNGFLKAKEEYPDLVSDNEIIGYLILNVCIAHLENISQAHFSPRSSAARTQPLSS
jgi:hypothetical protein